MTTVNLSDELVEMAKRHAKAFSRSTPKQIEHWAKIGKLVEENPDLSFQFVQDILLALNDPEPGTPFRFTEIEPPAWYDNPKE
jgi:hypothetical protein